MYVRELNSLPELVRRAAARFGEAPALERSDFSEDSRMSYARLLDAMRRGAGALSAHGFAQGDRVLLAVESRPEWAAAFFAILEVGLTAVPIPADTTPDSAAAIAAHAKAQAIVVSDRTRNLAAKVKGAFCVRIEELLQRDAPPPEAQPHGAPERLAVLAFTSGSTQRPRAVELTHENLLANLDALLQVRRIRGGDALLSMLPLAHMFELTGGLLAPLACGARVVYTGSLLPNRLVEALHDHRITHALAVPALVSALYEEVVDQLVAAGIVDAQHHHLPLAERANRVRSLLSKEDLEQILTAVRARVGDTFHTFVVGGAAVDPAMAEILDAVGIRMELGYGLTEASPIVTVGFSAECPRGSVGRPLPDVEVRIDRNGEILVRGPNIMKGYHKDPGATSSALQDGWLRTGDYGRLDEGGFLFVTGRLKEAMVTAAGETIYPEEIEPHYAHPLFLELCVTALRGSDGNDLPTLFVVPLSPEVPEDELQRAYESLRAAAPSRLRVKRMIRMNDALPRTASGKIRRRLLAQRVNRVERDHE